MVFIPDDIRKQLEYKCSDEYEDVYTYHKDHLNKMRQRAIESIKEYKAAKKHQEEFRKEVNEIRRFLAQFDKHKTE